MIYLDSELDKKIDLNYIKNKTEKILIYLSLNKDLSVLLVDDNKIKDLNKKFRNVDSVTDVLSFPQTEGIFGNSTILGDVVISYPQAERQAPISDNNTKEEIIYLIIHSILHLIGYDHYTKNEKEIMQKKEKEIFNFVMKQSIL